MDIRINHRFMTREQKDTLVEAILVLKNDVDSVLRPGRQNRYDDYVQVHHSAMGGPGAFMPMPHRSPHFSLGTAYFCANLSRTCNAPLAT